MPDLNAHTSAPPLPLPAAAPLLLMGDAPPVAEPLLCQHCSKPFREHTWFAECIGSPEAGGSDLELLGTTWTPRVRELFVPSAEAVAQESAARGHRMHRCDDEGRLLPMPTGTPTPRRRRPFPTQDVRDLIGDPERDLRDFQGGRYRDSAGQQTRRAELFAVLPRVNCGVAKPKKPLTFEAKGALCLLGLAIPVAAVLYELAIGRL